MKKGISLPITFFILLILGIIVLVISLSGFLPYAGKLANKIFGFGLEPVPEDMESVKKIAEEEVFYDYENCLNINDDKCLCLVRIRNYPGEYLFSFSEPNKIKLYREGVQAPILEKTYNADFNCYLVYEKGNLIMKHERLMTLQFKGKPFLALGTALQPDKKYNMPYSISDKKYFYKEGNNVCFILPDLVDINNLNLNECK